MQLFTKSRSFCLPGDSGFYPSAGVTQVRRFGAAGRGRAAGLRGSLTCLATLRASQ